MVAVIKTGHSIHRIINYNENKVKEGVAACIGEGNYPMDIDKMSLDIKLNRLLKQAALNENVTRKSVHISLNFDPSEKDMGDEKLMAVARDYMVRIGFGQQPYLVYRHDDAGHPHIHITSIKVRENGKRIDMQNIGRNQSETARKAIEQAFGLVPAESHKRPLGFTLKPVDAGRVTYGKAATKRAMANVLDAVIGKYRFASLPELNAVLGQYNVRADRGSENSRTYKGHGLLYRVLDNEQKAIGVPIKASDFHSNPTLKVLEGYFASNESARNPHKARVRNAVDRALLGKNRLSLAQLLVVLEKEGIHTVLRKNAQELVFGITYIDHTTKCVYNGSALGKAYSAKAMIERCAQEPVETISINQKSLQITKVATVASSTRATPESSGTEVNTLTRGEMLDEAIHTIMGPENTVDYIPGALKRKKKKKRKGE